VSDRYFTQEGRKTYITSAAYLELIHSYTELTSAKQSEIMEAKMRYVGGVDRLLFAAEQVRLIILGTWYKTVIFIMNSLN
jgi:dynein heavy chain